MSQRWVAIVRNRRSGAGRGRERIRDLIAGLRRHGLRPRLFSKRERLSERLSQTIHSERLVAVVAAGGDGTVNDCLNRFTGVPLAILPMGTENLVARYLNVPPSGARAADTIAAGRTRRIDLGRVGQQQFVLLASAGFDAEVVHRLHARRTGNIRRLTYLPRILECFRKYEYPQFRVYLDGNPAPLAARMAVVMNLPMYAFGLRPAATAQADDGLLDVRLFERGSTFQMLRYVYMVARGRHESLPDVRSVQARRIRLESDVPVPFEVDGDPAGWSPVEISVEPAALEVFVP
ncbi:MAG TPA: diacylglycerol kinase family protein [Planctomycetaceae bacterium]|nr:diacylglycerol kinase family protein [Planctomycetaceae bacterium]